MYSAARTELRNRFNDQRDLDPQDPETKKKVREACEVARILRQNVVQGEAKEGAQHYRKPKTSRLRIYSLTWLRLIFDST